MAPTPLPPLSSTPFDETAPNAVANSGAAHYLPAMPGEHVHPRPGERNAPFSHAEICWLWVIVLAAVVVSATAALISDRTIPDLLGGGSTPEQTNANG